VDRPCRRGQPCPIQLNDAFIAAADIKNEGKAAILLFERDGLIDMYGLAGSSRADDEHDPNAV
jgi:hypothetical protein